jgi:hypothetical protein
MKFNQLFNLVCETKSTPIIVVDVQPAYETFSKSTRVVHQNVVKFLNQSQGDVLMFVNADETGLTEDTIPDIQYWYEENGFDDWSRVEIVDKGYGYLRPWMDTGVKPSSIIRAIRIMYQNKISDSRGIVEDFDDNLAHEKWKELLDDDYIPEDSISVNWISVKKLREYNNCYIMGGGRNECLREVELIMNAFNIKYTRIDSLVYGD